MDSPARLPLFAVFPGQGSQHVGMAKDLCENFQEAREVFEEASDATHLNLKKLCFDGPESDLTLTENTQPALLTASIAAFRVAQRQLDFRPEAVAGHSLGEYSALVAAESLGLATAARWVRERGAAMQKAVPAGDGLMAAILGLEDTLVEKLCQSATALAKQERQGIAEEPSVPAIVEPANFNTPGQVVIAGSRDGVRKAMELLTSGSEFAGGKAILLSVSAPFHCQLMKPARERMHDVILKSQSQDLPRAPRFPYVPNRTGRLTLEPGVISELLLEQIDHPVLWKQSVAGLLGSNFGRAVEFGPGKVLCGMIKRIAAQQSRPCTLASVSDSAGIKTLESFLKA